MPGYEVYRDDGFLLIRLRRADWSAIPQEELEGMALTIDKAADPKSLVITALDDASYEKAKADQLTLGFPKADGSRMTKKQFIAEHLAIQSQEPK